MTIPQSTPAPVSPQLCECGCGQPTRISPKNDTRAGHVKGRAVRFVKGHQWRKGTPEYLIDSAGCWICQRGQDGKGYGRFSRRGRQYYAHVLNYEAKYGPVPEGMELDHKCRNRACCNPDHLEPVTHQVNVRRGASTKLNPEKVRAIRASFAAGGVSKSALARQFEVSNRTIGHVLAGRGWADVA